MNNFVTDPLWTEEPQPEALLPARADKHKPHPAERKPGATENHAERLQRIAGNAVLAREAEEALAVKAKVEEAVRKPAAAPVAKGPETAKPAPKAAAKPATERKPEADKRVAADKAKAAARANALAAVLAHFERDPGRADLLGLARLVEDAPSGIAEAIAQTLAQAVMRADPAQRAAIAARFKAQLADHRELKLAKLLAGRLAFLAVPARAPAPPPPPPPPAPNG